MSSEIAIFRNLTTILEIIAYLQDDGIVIKQIDQDAERSQEQAKREHCGPSDNLDYIWSSLLV